MNKLNDIKTIVREAMINRLHEAYCELRSDRNINLTTILDEVRGVCGITIVSVSGPAKPVTKNKEITELKIKFLVSTPSLREHLKKMIINAQRVEGVFSFRILRVNKLQRRGGD